MKKVWVIVRKEWAEVFKNRFVLFTVGFLPLILTALPLIMLHATRGSGDLADLSFAEMPGGFNAFCEGMSAAECGQYFLVSQFMLLFMLMPLAIPVTIASYSIVGEKTTRTLEPLLATPVTTLELLAGKGLAAALPAIAATWLGFGVFAVGTRILSESTRVLARLIDPLWLMAIFVVGPLLAIAAVSVAVMVSSRANDPRVAEQLSMLVILPLLAIFFGQISGLFFINAQLILWMAIVLALVDAGLLAFATQLFQRETILTRWK
ncbi:MAG: ABC transporter permease subunit [Anaerolineales bacterium]|nr:ABC transporter permease subunit [Anaerolineales bacterium]